jgi:hypothetical protein
MIDFVYLLLIIIPLFSIIVYNNLKRTSTKKLFRTIEQLNNNISNLIISMFIIVGIYIVCLIFLDVLQSRLIQMPGFVIFFKTSISLISITMFVVMLMLCQKLIEVYKEDLTLLYVIMIYIYIFLLFVVLIVMLYFNTKYIINYYKIYNRLYNSNKNEVLNVIAEEEPLSD